MASHSSSPSRVARKAPESPIPKKRKMEPRDDSIGYNELFHVRTEGCKEWGWYPDMIRKWVRQEQVPAPHAPGASSSEVSLPPLYHPLEQAFAALVAKTDRDFRNMREAASEITGILEREVISSRRIDELVDRVTALEVANVAL